MFGDTDQDTERQRNIFFTFTTVTKISTFILTASDTETLLKKPQNGICWSLLVKKVDREMRLSAGTLKKNAFSKNYMEDTLCISSDRSLLLRQISSSSNSLSVTDFFLLCSPLSLSARSTIYLTKSFKYILVFLIKLAHRCLTLFCTFYWLWGIL